MTVMTNRYLPTSLRKALEKVIQEARVVAEEGAADALRRLGVADKKAPIYLDDAERELRRHLRAHARALGDRFDAASETQEVTRLGEATAYAHWHRMLFARFLADRRLLRHPVHDIIVTLEDCRELAAEEGLPDEWAVAERYAAVMLPAVFQIDDPVLLIDFDPVHTQKLHRLVTELDDEVFEAEDSLGWTYQFWRSAEKDAVNKSNVKVGSEELPAVTQLFTEPYMVRFILHNTLGAWWASKVLASDPGLARNAVDENELRSACSLPHYTFDMLRFVREDEEEAWRPAAGGFPGWPSEARAITVLDPCCGSGHFLTEALTILAMLREAEEQLVPKEAVAAVLKDNLHGLEIDGRCVQIAAFAVAVCAWRIGGWQALPSPHIAWVGAPPPLPKRDFIALAEGSGELEYALAALHDLFSKAPILGSLIEPIGADLFEAEKLKKIESLLLPVLEKSRRGEPERREGAIAARGMADAAASLHRKYTLVATNVPYLGRGEQSDELGTFLDRRFSKSKSCLSTAMLERIMRLTEAGGSVATVTKQEWCFLVSYKSFRQKILSDYELNWIAFLGEEAWEAFGQRGPLATLSSISVKKPSQDSKHFAIDLTNVPERERKATELAEISLVSELQDSQLGNPDSRISAAKIERKPLLNEHAQSFQGLITGDGDRFRRFFWETKSSPRRWRYFQSTPKSNDLFSGREGVLLWENDGVDFARKQGLSALGRRGIAVTQFRTLSPAYYYGDLFDNNISPIIPYVDDNLPVVSMFCKSLEYKIEVRKIDNKKNVTNATLTKVPFDFAAWKAKYELSDEDEAPEPQSNDPTQWIFHGHPRNCQLGSSLHVALARLCGYAWPAEADANMRLSDEARSWVNRTVSLSSGDNDGLLGVPPVAGEKPLADRLHAYLAEVYGSEWSDDLERRLIVGADATLDNKVAREVSLEAWVRDRAFRQHCTLFGQRPFLWHISDGLKDGFSVFVHYHRFDQGNLRKLTYTLLGDWLARAKDEGNALRYEKGRELQQRLEKVLEGEAPYDIFVRWKSLAQQPLGWEPDLDDGVRQNIRPFIEAGVLTHDLSKILKDKDRGADGPSAPWYKAFKGERRNDHHTTLDEKTAARDALASKVVSKS